MKLSAEMGEVLNVFSPFLQRPNMVENERETNKNTNELRTIQPGFNFETEN